MVNVTFTDGKPSYDQHAFFQWDYGRTLIISGLSLADSVQVHFARKNVPAEIVLGNTVDNVTTVNVPATTLQYAGEFNVYIFITTETTGKTYKTLTFYTKGREKPVDYAAEAEPGIVDQLNNKLNQIIATGIASYIPDENAVNQMIQNYVTANMIANNLLTISEGLALDARQGKVLNEAKLDKEKVVNNLTTTEEGNALDARQGNESIPGTLGAKVKAVNDNFVQQLTAPTVVSGRATSITGGYIKIGKMVFVDVKFTSAITFNGTIPLQGFPFTAAASVSHAILNAINLTDSSVAYANIAVINGNMNANLVSGKEYVMSGWYSLA